MRTMTDEGFVWLEEPTAVAARSLTVVTAIVPPLPSVDVPAAAEVTRAVELTRWKAVPNRAWKGRLVAVARSVAHGRRAVLGACLELAEGFALELRQALSVTTTRSAS